MSERQGRKIVVTNRTDVTPSSSTETNTQEQEVNNLPTGTIERCMQRDKRELVFNNSYGYGYTLDISNWPILYSLPLEIISQIHMIMPLDETAVFFATKDKTVYGLGISDYLKNIDDHQSKHYQPTLEKLDQLCGKNIYFFEYDRFFFALTEDGEVYGWVEKKDYKEESGCYEIFLTPTKVVELNEEHVIEMAFTHDHNIVLTKDGKIYNWGIPEYEKLFNRSEGGLPWQVEFGLDSDKIVHISCGVYFNMALTKNGNVYSWGKNKFGVLGLNNCDEETIITHPSIISSLTDFVIVKVVCGKLHTLALTATGELYVWGQNEQKQLGYETEDTFSKIPTKLNVSKMGKIVDICARYDLSMAIDEKQHMYKWGLISNKVVPVPTFIYLPNMYNIFKYGTPYIICKPQIDHNENKLELQDLIFNDSSTSDITIEVDGKVFYTHKKILNRSWHFINLSKKNRIIVHDKYSYNVYEAFLKYLYTGIVDVHLSSEEALELMKLADAHNETNLKSICVKSIQKGINLHNVDVIFKGANSYNSKELKKHCFEFLFVEVVNMMRKFKT